jgi:ribosomal protein S24E
MSSNLFDKRPSLPIIFTPAPQHELGTDDLENSHSMHSSSGIQRSTSAPLTGGYLLKSEKSAETAVFLTVQSPPVSSRLSLRNGRMSIKPSPLALAHLTGSHLKTFKGVTPDGTPITQRSSPIRKPVPAGTGNDDFKTTARPTGISKSRSRFPTLPSYKELCRRASLISVVEGTSIEQVKSGFSKEKEIGKEKSMPAVASHVYQDRNSIIAGYRSATQHSALSIQDPEPDDPIPTIELTAPGGPDHLQHLRHHRATVLEEIIKNSITTTLSVKIRASVANEIKARCGQRFSKYEMFPYYAHSILKECGKHYWLCMYEGHDTFSHYAGRSEIQNAQLIDKIYSKHNREVAVFFWSLYHQRMTYAEISFQLSLPLGALLQWILQMCN